MALVNKLWIILIYEEGFSPEFWLELRKVADSSSPSSQLQRQLQAA